MPQDNPASAGLETVSVFRSLWDAFTTKLKGVSLITTNPGSDAEYHALIVAADHEHQSLQDHEEVVGEMGLQFQEEFEKSREVREGDSVAQVAAAVSFIRVVRVHILTLECRIGISRGTYTYYLIIRQIQRHFHLDLPCRNMDNDLQKRIVLLLVCMAPVASKSGRCFIHLWSATCYLLEISGILLLMWWYM